MTNTADNITSTIRITEYNHHIHCVSASVMLQANGKTCSIILRYLAVKMKTIDSKGSIEDLAAGAVDTTWPEKEDFRALMSLPLLDLIPVIKPPKTKIIQN